MSSTARRAGPGGAQAAARPRLVLASGSARRLALLQQIGIEPDLVLPSEIDETPARSESPRTLAARLAAEKAEAAARLVSERHHEAGPTFIVSADTVVCVGRRILPKCEMLDEAAACLRLLSGRSHRVYTGLAVVTPAGRRRHRLAEARLRFKRLSSQEIDTYLETGEWRGKAGGYAIQGLAGSFAVKLVGSYSAVVGLPLYETMSLLTGEGYPAYLLWNNQV